MRVRAWKRAALALTMTAAATALGAIATAAPARADGCFSWNRMLSQGRTGEDVRQLQIRVAGWPGYRSALAIDGVYGPETAAAVRRFQIAYGLKVDGIAGPQTFGKLYQLQDGDCTPIHFSFSEMDNGCGGSGWSGGPLSPAATRENALKTMWKLEALRHSLNDHPLIVTSGFRSRSCNTQVGGASNSQHLYGKAADVISYQVSLCGIAREARDHGFTGLLGPGYPGHSNHIHLDSRADAGSGRVQSTYWAAPACGVTNGGSGAN